MSSTLSYAPIMPVKYKTLSDKLKFILRDKYGLEDGSAKLTRADINYLEGIRDAGNEEIQAVIDCIKKYEEVNLFLQ